jgi:starch-binding outer membrane protein, SusD/RagB family
LDGILDACQNLLSTGFDGVNGTYNMDWRAWLDPTGTDSEVTSVYEYWNMMVPQHFVLQAEISLWKGDYQNTVNVPLHPILEDFIHSLSTRDLRFRQNSVIQRIIWLIML